jgi:hypothetical protein
MRKSLHTAVLLTTTLLSSAVFSQSADRFAYAVTDIQKDGAGWNYLRKIDFKSGKFSDVLLNGNDFNQVRMMPLQKPRSINSL